LIQYSITSEELFKYTCHQINSLYKDGDYISFEMLYRYSVDTLDRLAYCFKHIKKPYYFENNINLFNHLHGDHYAMFLYLLSNTIWEVDKNEQLASKIFLLNKMLHGIDAFYQIKLPEIFFFIHPVGTVLGNAKYSNYLVVYQNCSIGANEKLNYPIFKGSTLLFSKSSIIGDCTIGSNTIFGANSFILDTNISDNSVVVNSFPNHRVLKNDRNILDIMFK